jgi:hypothetical protein
MGGKTPETCRAANKRQDNKLENCCIWLVICLNCTMMQGLTNLKQDRTVSQPLASPYHTINALQSETHVTSKEVRVRTLRGVLSKNMFQKHKHLVL